MDVLYVAGGGVAIGCVLFALWKGFSLRETVADIKRNFWLWLIAVISIFLWFELAG